jgi:phosphatidylinositol-3-phosphatase
LECHARHAWGVIPCLLASLVLANSAPAADEIHTSAADPLLESIANVPTPAVTAAPRAAAVMVPRLDHVIVVVMENHSYTQVKGLAYTASLISKYTSFSQSYAVTHPSEPNYLALWAASTLGLSDDSCPPSGSPYSSANLGHSCEAAGLTWASYCENLPSVGSTACSSSDNMYKRKHHPCPDFNNLSHSHEYPYTQFARDVTAGKLPALSFVVPNMCNDTHDCSTTTGDNWLKNNLPAMITAAGPRGLVILTWDEDDKGSGNHILTVFAGPLVKANYVCPTTINHYTVVRVICDVLGLAPFGNATSKVTPTDIWDLAVLAVEPQPLAAFSLSDPSPNPFHTAMTATLRLPSESQVHAFVVDASGRRVRDLFAERRSATSQVTWDGSTDNGGRAAPGLYFLYVKAGSEQVVRKLALTR